MDIEKIIRSGESETVEFKASLAETKQIIETLSAFSNGGGGMVYVGVDDRGSVRGVDIGKSTLENLANEIKRNTDPPLFPSIYIEVLDGKEVICIEVNESPTKPMFAFDKVFKRVGKTNQRITSNEIRKIFSEGLENKWDSQLLPSASLDDIDWEFVTNFYIPRYERRTKTKIRGKPEPLLVTLGCVKDGAPTNGGILLFGKNPQRFFINSYIALARYKTTDVSTERLDYKEFQGNIYHQIDKCDRYIFEHIAMMSKQYPGIVEREDIPEYGLFTIRELITNAVCHRDYRDQSSKIIIKIFSDSIEFFNLGGLPKNITIKNITEQQYSRNPVIARSLAKIGFIEELGEGWDKILDEHGKHPLHPKMPKIGGDGTSMLVTIYSTREKMERPVIGDLNERQRTALEYIKTNGRITNREYQKLNLVGNKTAYKDLSDLVDKGVLIPKGKGRSRRYILRS